MRRIGVILGALFVAAGLALVLGGAILPRAHRVTSEVVVDRSRDDTWRVVRDLAVMPQWCAEVDRSTRQHEVAGREQWLQRVGGFELRLDVVDERPPEMFATRVVTPEEGLFGGRWIYELAPDGTRTRVRITEDAWIGPWPFRSMAWLFGYHATIDRCLAGLAKHLGQKAEPRHIGVTPRPVNPT